MYLVPQVRVLKYFTLRRSIHPSSSNPFKKKMKKNKRERKGKENRKKEPLSDSTSTSHQKKRGEGARRDEIGFAYLSTASIVKSSPRRSNHLPRVRVRVHRHRIQDGRTDIRRVVSVKIESK